MGAIGRILRRVLPARVLAAGLLCTPEATLLTQFGFARTLKTRRAEDENGAPLPWLPYCVTALLKRSLSDELKVLEFGAGQSTRFFMTRVHSVVALEHDSSWADRLRYSVGNNVRIVPTKNEAASVYLQPLSSIGETFDLILVDGLFRFDCVQRALDLVSPRGVIILDDSERDMYSGAKALVQSAGYRSLELVGHKPLSTQLHSSAIFYRDGNCLNL